MLDELTKEIKKILKEKYPEFYLDDGKLEYDLVNDTISINVILKTISQRMSILPPDGGRRFG